ncbi:hypothetical protein HOD08_04000 [bacterium]|nr:hypothetical protein [bacterium]
MEVVSCEDLSGFSTDEEEQEHFSLQAPLKCEDDGVENLSMTSSESDNEEQENFSLQDARDLFDSTLGHDESEEDFGSSCDTLLMPSEDESDEYSTPPSLQETCDLAAPVIGKERCNSILRQSGIPTTSESSTSNTQQGKAKSSFRKVFSIFGKKKRAAQNQTLQQSGITEPPGTTSPGTSPPNTTKTTTPPRRTSLVPTPPNNPHSNTFYSDMLKKPFSDDDESDTSSFCESDDFDSNLPRRPPEETQTNGAVKFFQLRKHPQIRASQMVLYKPGFWWEHPSGDVLVVRADGVEYSKEATEEETRGKIDSLMPAILGDTFAAKMIQGISCCNTTPIRHNEHLHYPINLIKNHRDFCSETNVFMSGLARPPHNAINYLGNVNQNKSKVLGHINSGNCVYFIYDLAPGVSFSGFILNFREPGPCFESLERFIEKNCNPSDLVHPAPPPSPMPQPSNDGLKIETVHSFDSATLSPQGSWESDYSDPDDDSSSNTPELTEEPPQKAPVTISRMQARPTIPSTQIIPDENGEFIQKKINPSVSASATQGDGETMQQIFKKMGDAISGKIFVKGTAFGIRCYSSTTIAFGEHTVKVIDFINDNDGFRDFTNVFTSPNDGFEPIGSVRQNMSTVLRHINTGKCVYFVMDVAPGACLSGICLGVTDPNLCLEKLDLMNVEVSQ